MVDIHFVGAGGYGRKVIVVLRHLQQEMKAFSPGGEDNEDDKHFRIYFSENREAGGRKAEDRITILAGKTDDPCWEDARKTWNLRPGFLLMTIGSQPRRKEYASPLTPAPGECMFLPAPAQDNPRGIARLAVELYCIHTSWRLNPMGSLIGYDPADTKAMFAGCLVQVRQMSANRKYAERVFTRFLRRHQREIGGVQALLLSLWGRDDFPSVAQAQALAGGLKQLARPDAAGMMTLHILPEGDRDFRVTLFMASNKTDVFS